MVQILEKVPTEGAMMEPIAVPAPVAARLVSLSVRTIQELARKKLIPAKTVGGRTIFPVAQLREWAGSTEAIKLATEEGKK